MTNFFRFARPSQPKLLRRSRRFWISFGFWILDFGFVAPAFSQERVAVLAPSITETLYALGLGNRIIAVCTYCNEPEEVKEKKRIGDLRSPNYEVIAAMKPDLYLAPDGVAVQRIAERIEKFGIETFLLPEVKDMEGVYATISLLAGRFGVEERGEEIIASMRKEIGEVSRARRPDSERPSVYIELLYPPLWTSAEGSFIHDILHLLGAKNVFEDIQRPYFQVSKESVFARQPDIILSLSGATAEEIAARAAWGELEAVSNKRIIDDISRDELLHPSPRIVKGIRKLARRIRELERGIR